MKNIFLLTILLELTAVFSLVFADNDINEFNEENVISVDENEYSLIDRTVFKESSIEYIENLSADEPGYPGMFQSALIYYRLGNLTTNIEYKLRAVELLEKVALDVTNVYTFSYLGIAYASLTGKRLGVLNKAFSALNLAIDMYPRHYLPRFYRGTLHLFLPAILGAREAQGLEDMAIVIEQLPNIDRGEDFKALVYFMNAVYWERKKDFPKALSYVEFSLDLAENQTFLEKLNEKKTNYISNLE